MTQLYRAYSEEGELLYVGISLSAISRLTQHRHTSEWFARLHTLRIEHFETTAEAMQAERAAITAEQPLFNIRHRKGPLLTYADVTTRDYTDEPRFHRSNSAWAVSTAST